MWTDLVCVEVVFMGQSDLYWVQLALSLGEGEHSPAQSPSLSRPRLAQPWGHTEHGNTDTPPGLIDVLDKSLVTPPQPPLQVSTPSI